MLSPKINVKSKIMLFYIYLYLFIFIYIYLYLFIFIYIYMIQGEDLVQNDNIVYCATRGKKVYFKSVKFDARAKQGKQSHESFIVPYGRENPFFDAPVEKKRVQHGKNIYFTRVIVAFAFLIHQTVHSQNNFFFPSCTIYFVFKIGVTSFLSHYLREYQLYGKIFLDSI